MTYGTAEARSTTAAMAALILTSPILSWWAIGDQSVPGADSYGFGPYYLDVRMERAVGFAALLAAAIAIGALTRSALRRTLGRESVVVAAILIVVGFVGAFGWRIETAAVFGANIGGGFVLLIGPIAIAGLLVVAARLAARVPGRFHDRPKPLVLAALLSAPALFAAHFVIGLHDLGQGVITLDAYDHVRAGETRAEVKNDLGHAGSDTYWFFPPVPAGTECDYYTEDGPDSVAHQFQFCFRGGVLVSKDASNQAYGP